MDRKLQNKNMYSFAYHDENYTLLHGATKYGCLCYVKKLVFYGFEILQKPRSIAIDKAEQCESSWDVSKRYPSKVNDYFYSVLV